MGRSDLQDTFNCVERRVVARYPERSMTAAIKYCAIGLLWLSIVSAAHAVPISYSYDALNRLTSVVYPDGTTVTYTYDAAGNRLNRTVVSVAPTLPALTGMTPNSGGQGLTVKVILSGTN